MCIFRLDSFSLGCFICEPLNIVYINKKQQYDKSRMRVGNCDSKWLEILNVISAIKLAILTLVIELLHETFLSVCFFIAET